MTLTAGQVINSARDYHGALSTTNAPQRLAWAHLSRVMDTLMSRITTRVPGFAAQLYTTALTTAVFDDGIDLSDVATYGVKAIVDCRFLYNSSSPSQFSRAQFVPWEQRDLATPIPAITLRDNVIYLLNGNNVDTDLATTYQNYSQLTLTYVPNMTPVTADGDELTGFPDDALEMLATAVAAFLLRRMVGSPAWNIDRKDADYYDAMADGARERFLTRLTRGIVQTQSYYVRDVGP